MENWRSRLNWALEQSGLSMREASLAADCGHSYLHKILKEGHEPSLERLARIATVLNVSIAWLITGVEMSKQTEEFTRMYMALKPDQRERMFDLLHSLAPEPPKQD